MRTLFTALSAFAIASAALAGACPGDTNGDNAVDFADLNAVLSSFNQTVNPPGTGPDVTGDGLVSFADLNVVVGAFNAVCAFDARLVALEHPASTLGGQPFSITVTIRHNAAAPTDVPVSITLGASITNHVIPAAPPNADVEATLNLTAPAATTSCAAGAPTALEACVMLDGDADASNDCASAAISVDAAHSDLRVTLLHEPSSAMCCSQITWSVRVRNHGNIASTATCFRTGINCIAGQGQWSCNLGMDARIIPALEPGQVEEYSFVYDIPCWAPQVQQWLKVEIGSMPGCFDACPAGNFIERPVQITPQSK